MKKTIIKNFNRLLVLLVFGALINIAAAGFIDNNTNKTTVKLTNIRDGILLIPDSSDETVGMYDSYDGTYLGVLINGAGLFTTPINAILGPDENIYVSDQVADSIFVFDNTGTYLYTYADASDGLNNIRGIEFHEEHLFVTSGDDYVAEFDGPHSRLPDFISGGIDPFDLLFLPDNTCLVNDITGDHVLLYSETGSLIQIITSIDFPEQTQFDSLTPGAFLTTGFSDNFIIDYDLDGTITQTTPFSLGRGVYRLGNGNLLATNANGAQEIQPGTGSIIQTKKVGSCRFIELYESPKIPDLDCNGDLDWEEVEPGAIVEGSIEVINIGEAESFLDWEIESYPDWGNWTFDPESGNDLTPEEGAFTIDVTVEAPNQQEETFTGEIVLINTNDPSDSCTISVSLATPFNQQTLFMQIVSWLFERFPVLKLIFG